MKITATHIFVTLGILTAIIIGVAIYYFYKGKKTTTIADIPKDVAGSPDPENNPAGDSLAALTQMANDLFTDMDGLTFNRNNPLYHKYMEKSDTDFVQVYNIFNQKYQADSKQTLREWINDEYGIGADFIEIKSDILSRMNRLNLK